MAQAPIRLDFFTQLLSIHFGSAYLFLWMFQSVDNSEFAKIVNPVGFGQDFSDFILIDGKEPTFARNPADNNGNVYAGAALPQSGIHSYSQNWIAVPLQANKIATSCGITSNNGDPLFSEQIYAAVITNLNPKSVKMTWSSSGVPSFSFGFANPKLAPYFPFGPVLTNPNVLLQDFTAAGNPTQPQTFSALRTPPTLIVNGVPVPP